MTGVSKVISMAKSSNPMQGYHRQKRQKQVQKNKEQRIKARDEKVVQSKTVDQVQDEIRKIKKRKNLQQSEQQKLQRLEKELKLVQEAAANRPKEPTHIQPQENLPLTELDDPRKSVYYDEKMNPYGAPPPGRPRLYHHRGGGVTMDIRLAVVPGEEPPPPPPPPRKPTHSPQNSTRNDMHGGDSHSRHNAGNSSRTAAHHSTSTSATKIGGASSQPTNKNHMPSKSMDSKDKDALDEDKPLVTPSLPAPSKAVQRSRRGKASVDIWASTEEVEYERRANLVDLEADDVGAVVAKKALDKPKKKKLPLEIYYKDRMGQVQGPFPKSQMQGWFAAGFFPPSTMVKTNRNETWTLITNLIALRPESSISKQEESVEDRVASLKPNDSLENRIAALKGQSAIEARITALKGKPSIEKLEEESDKEPSSVQDRIAALRTTSQQSTQADETSPPPPVPPPPPPAYSVQEEDEVPAYPIDDIDDSSPYEVNNDADVPAYPVNAEDDNGPSVAPPYPIEDEVVSYPIDEDSAYLTDTMYPVPDDEDETAYPVTEVYPVVDTYPSGEINDAEVPIASDEAPIYPLPGPALEAPKKVVKVDESLVAFLPSHLQSRKRKQGDGRSSKTAPQKKPKPQSAATLSLQKDDDVDRFMEEIDDLP